VRHLHLVAHGRLQPGEARHVDPTAKDAAAARVRVG
jgi:hypothetical protein